MILDRAGVVGNDGPTHHGCYDLAYLGCIPNLIIMSPSDEIELRNMVQTCADYDDGPTVLRYPRGVGYGAEKLQMLMGYELKDDDIPVKGSSIEIGKGRIIRRPGGIRALREESEDKSPAANGSVDSRLKSSSASGGRGKIKEDRIAILTLGTRLSEALIAADEVEEAHPDLAVTVADARFMKPLDVDMIRSLAEDNGILITVEEGSIGGFGDHVLHFLSLDGLLDEGELKFRPMVLPDTYFEAATQYEQYEMAGLNAHHIKGTVLRLAKKVDVPVLAE
jgi:1-deoxy-D-xylulose-5-phosphate synthase